MGSPANCADGSNRAGVGTIFRIIGSPADAVVLYETVVMQPHPVGAAAGIALPSYTRTMVGVSLDRFKTST
jgi:hypothetical protein